MVNELFFTGSSIRYNSVIVILFLQPDYYTIFGQHNKTVVIVMLRLFLLLHAIMMI